MRKLFPVLHEPNYKGEKEFIPWEVIAPHETQACEKHGQSLERLASRGGLSYREMLAVLRDRGFDYENGNRFADIQYEFAVLRIVRDFYTKGYDDIDYMQYAVKSADFKSQQGGGHD